MPMSNSIFSAKINGNSNHMMCSTFTAYLKKNLFISIAWVTATKLFRKVGVRTDMFRLDITGDTMGFTNISKMISANDEEEVWVGSHNYRDKKHLEEVAKKMQNDKNCNGYRATS